MQNEPPISTTSLDVVTILNNVKNGPKLHSHGPRECLAPEELQNAIVASLENPFGYPPLSDSVFPGDLVAVAFDESLPQPDLFAVGVVRALRKAGVEDSNITLLLPAEEGMVDTDSSLGTSIKKALVDMDATHVRIQTHDSHDQQELGLLGIGNEKQPIYFARTLCDADVVLSLGTHKPQNGPFSLGAYNPIYPAFSTEKTAGKFNSVASLDSPIHRKRMIGEVERAGQLLGVALVILAVPAAGAGVSAVLAGTAEVVQRHANELYQDAWGETFTTPTSLAVATISLSEPSNSNRTWVWEALARTIHSALAIVEDGGAIALCGVPKLQLGEAMSLLHEEHDLATLLPKLQHVHSADAQAAWMLATAREAGPVYIQSEWPADFVEACGLSPILKNKELERLTASYKDWTLLEEANRIELKQTFNTSGG